MRRQFFLEVEQPSFGAALEKPRMSQMGAQAPSGRELGLNPVEPTTRMFFLARTAEDLLRAGEQHCIAAYLGIEGAHALDGDITRVEHFARRGVRYLGFLHFTRNEAGCPAYGDSFITPIRYCAAPMFHSTPK